MLIFFRVPQCHSWQVGIPAGREQYIHRLGRTGRAGKEGRGLLLLMPWEEVFLRSLKDISITESKAVQMTPAVEAKVPPFVVTGLLCCGPSTDYVLCMCENVFSVISSEIWTDLTNPELKTVSFVDRSSTMYRVHSPKVQLAVCNCHCPIGLLRIIAQNLSGVTSETQHSLLDGV